MRIERVSIQLVFLASRKGAKTAIELLLSEVSIQLVFLASRKDSSFTNLLKYSIVSIQLVFLASRKDRGLKSLLAIHSTGEFRKPLSEPYFSLHSCEELAFIKTAKKPEFFFGKGYSDFRKPPQKFAPA